MMFKIFKGIYYRRLPQYNVNRYASIIKMPSLSPTMDEGGIVEWHKKEGDSVAAGDLLCEVQTDKAVVGMEAEEDGVLAKIIIAKDSKNITVGTTIAIMADATEDWKVVASKAILETVDSKKAIKSSLTVEAVPTVVETLSQEKVGPAARLLLHSYGIEASQVSHTGPHNTLMKSDVVQHIGKAALKPIPPISSTSTKAETRLSAAAYIDLPLTNMRQTIAKRLSASKSSTPHFYSTEEAFIDAVLNFRAKIKRTGVSVSVNDFMVAACALSLRLVPEVNGRLTADGDVVLNDTVDISVAVASETGLITPIVFGADKLSLSAIGSTVRALAEKARNNKLQPAEFMGGTFTISNLGMFGIKEFTAIINRPQSAILAVGAGIPRLVLDPADVTRPRLETRMRFTLSADARVVDPAAAARFLAHVKSYLEHPHALFSESGPAEAWGY